MKEETAIFPLPAGAELREQAQALARAAWLMGEPEGSSDPPVPAGDDLGLPQGSPPAGSHSAAKSDPFPLSGEGLPP